jgi:hypothetical protein
MICEYELEAKKVNHSMKQENQWNKKINETKNQILYHFTLNHLI